MNPHKHAELIKAWADGAEIERFLENYGIWISTDNKIIRWEDDYKYRIKPELKPDEVRFYRLWHEGSHWCDENSANIKATFDGETGKLKSAEVIQ